MSSNQNDALIRILWDDSAVQSGATKTQAAIGKVTESGALTRREFTRTGSEAAYALQLIGGKASAMNATLAQGVSTATQLGQAFAFGGGVGAGLTGAALLIGGIASALNTTTPEEIAFEKALDGVTDSATDAAKGLAQKSGATNDDATLSLKAAAANRDYAIALRDATKAQEEQKNILQQSGDTLGLLIKGLNVEGATLTTYAGELLKGTDAEKARVLALEAGQKALIGMTFAERDHLKAVVDTAPAILEQNRLLDVMKSNLPALSKEISDNAAATAKLADAHKKAQAGFAADTIAAQVDMARSVAKIYSDLGQRMGDAAEDAAVRQAQAEHDWLRTAQGYANDRANIEQDLADKIAGITADEADQESTAKTYAEVLRLRKKEQLAIDAANKDAQKSRTDLTAKERDALGEHNYTEGLADAASVKSAQRARRDADAQAAEVRRAEGEKEAAIRQRAQEEITTYQQAQAAASTAHNQRMKELTDTRDTTQKLRDDWYAVRDSVDATTRSIIAQSGVVDGMVGSGWGGWGVTKPQGWYANGLNTIVNRPTVIGVGERGPERVTVTPINQPQSSGGGTVVHVYIDGQEFRGMIRAETDRQNRGL